MLKHIPSIWRICRARWFISTFIVTIAWTAWWLAPRWPMAIHTFDAALGGRLPAQTNSAGNIVCEYRGPRNRSQHPRGWIILRLDSGEVLASRETGVGEWKQSPTGEFLVSADESGWQVIDVKSGHTVARIEPNQLTPAPTVRIQFSADGKRFALDSGGIAVFNTSNAQLVRHFPHHGGPFDINTNGSHLVAKLTNQNSLELVNIESGQASAILDEIKPLKYVAAKFSPQNKFIAVCADNNPSDDSSDSLHIWSIDHRRRLATHAIGTFESYPKSIWFSQNDRFLAVRERTDHVFDLAVQPPAELTSWLAGPTRHFFPADDGNVFLVSSMLHWSIFDPGNREPLFRRAKPATSGAMLSPDGHYVILIHRDQSIQSKGIIYHIQKLFGRLAFESYGAQFIDLESGQVILSLADRYPLSFDRPNRHLWTQRILEGATPGTYKTVLEKWELQRDKPPVWLWLVTFLGAVFLIREARHVLRRNS